MTSPLERGLQFLSDYIAIPSISAQGTGIREAMDLLLHKFDAMGFSARTLDVGGNPAVVAERIVDPEAPTLLFYNHYDVQPPDPLDEWESDPFVMTERDGILYGRGIADNKANLVTRMIAWEMLEEKPRYNVRFFVEGEEEVGSPTLDAICEAHPDVFNATWGIWESAYKDASGRPTLVLGAKGIVHGELHCDGANRDLHSSYAPLVDSPAWRLMQALTAIRADDGTIQLDGFYEGIVDPDAIAEEMLASVPFDEDAWLEDMGLAGFPENFGGIALKKRWFFAPTFNIAGLTSGYQGEGHKTVLPATASCKFDFRLVPGQDPERIQASLRRFLDDHGFSDVRIEHLTGYPAARTPGLDPFVGVVRSTASGVYGLEPVVMPNMPASGPMYLFARNMPCIGIGAGWHGSNIHSPNESIRRVDFEEAVGHVVAIFKALCR
jgi:acetylornithine deacetylase/succinyl-diaminopimelate desuccinylase-like protein